MRNGLREVLCYLCVRVSKKVNLEGSKYMVNPGSFTDFEHLSYCSVFSTPSLSLLWDKIYFNIYLVYLKTLLQGCILS